MVYLTKNNAPDCILAEKRLFSNNIIYYLRTTFTSHISYVLGVNHELKHHNSPVKATEGR